MKLLPLCLLLLLCYNPPYKKDKDFKTIYIENKKITVEVADTELKRALGLMYREKLEEDHGMLFIFPSPGYYSFWMKNTKIPLSIAFCDTNGVIFQIEDMQPFDEKTLHTPKFKIKYALEMNQGFFKKNNISVGAKIRFED